MCEVCPRSGQYGLCGGCWADVESNKICCNSGALGCPYLFFFAISKLNHGLIYRQTQSNSGGEFPISSPNPFELKFAGRPIAWSLCKQFESARSDGNEELSLQVHVSLLDVCEKSHLKFELLTQILYDKTTAITTNNGHCYSISLFLQSLDQSLQQG